MDKVAHEVVDAVFGVVIIAGRYEARWGQLEFRGGRLIGVRFAHHQWQSDDGLTIGLVIFPAPPASGVESARAVLRVYTCGALDTETDLGEVIVGSDSPPT
jgi:hypothetical protein